MRILHIIDSGGLYGAEMVLLNLVDEQRKMGLDPAIASIGVTWISEKPLETEARKRGLPLVKFRMFPGPNLPGMLKVLRYAQKRGFDILHSHGYKGDVAFGLMPKKLRKLPLVSTLHGWTSVNGFSKNAIYEWLQKKSLRHMDAVVLVHKGMLSHPKLKKLKGINFHIVHNGIPVDSHSAPSQSLNVPTSSSQTFSRSVSSPSHPPTFAPSEPLDTKILDFCSKGFTIGSIGRLSTEKGYKYLIEAFSLLIKKDKTNQPVNHLTNPRVDHSTNKPFDHLTNAKLVIIGEGYERKLLEELVVKYKLKYKVLLPGYRDNAKHYLPYFNAFVISSLTEGLPITLLEAMQAKVPIVATSVGGIPDALSNGEAGILVDPKNPESLAEAIDQLYHNESFCFRLTSAAYQRALECYTRTKMASDYLKVYRRVFGAF
jgi:glycosyltransferase involved in cell wall biosynthesis